MAISLEEAIKKAVKDMIDNEEIRVEIDDTNQIYLTTDNEDFDDEDSEENEEDTSEDEEEDEE
mgnify:FL=1|tara:strand:- start:6791 stop:6979 length:189 start_codon:yes stop_codon:yes gene_type:complete